MRYKKSTRWLTIAAAALSLTLVAAACSDDEATDTTAGGTTAPPPAAAEPFGAACADVPSAGDGSFEGMMTAPVATAAAANPLLSSLVADIEAAQLGDTLNSAEGLTVFAPTNGAFKAVAKADPAGVEAMMADPTGALAQLLTYHVVEGQIPPDQLAGTHTTLQGQSLTVEGSGESFTVNGTSMVVCGDIHTDNATVYVVDEVLSPPA
jgi:uncharacterized surface protein with fasciclin (FAS1) repeats